jgi:hypothetical protein
VRYEGIDALVEQMSRDVRDAADVLGVPRPEPLPVPPTAGG